MAKKLMALLLSLMLVLSCAPAFAVDSAAPAAAAGGAAWSGMTVSAKNGTVAIRTSYSDTEDFVQRIVYAFRDGSDPARTANYPVDFEKSYLVSKDDDIWATTKTVYASKDGAGDESPAFMINESYMAGNHGQSDGVQVTIPGHGLDFADIGSRWIGAGKGSTNGAAVESDDVAWNLIRINGDRLTFISDNKGAERGISYTFWQGVPGSVLVREDDSAQTLTFPSTVSNKVQLQPSTRNSEVNCYGISKGVILDLEDGMEFDCDEFIIEESYEVVDPSTIADAIRENAPEGGYTANPDITVGGKTMVNYNIVYTFRKDGTMLQEIDHEVLQNIRIGHSPMVMHKMRENFTGGDIYRYIPNTTSFETKDINGETLTYDFSTPHKIYSKAGEAVTYPVGYVMPRTECVDTEYPAERFIEYYTDADGDFAATYAEGLLPVGYASKENWKSTESGVFYFYKSLKSYPYTYAKYSQPAGSRIKAVSYKKYVPAPEGAEDTRSYTIAYGDTLYTYVDMFKSGETFTLPENAEVFNKSANVEVNDGVATANFASGDTHAYIVATSPYDDGIAGLSKDEALAMVAFEKICPEPMTMITKDIKLPSTAGEGDVTITWSSSDESVITNDGKVTRDLIDAKEVTLTATVTDSEGSTPVRYNLTVLPVIYNVFKSQNFYYPNDDMSAPALSGSFISASKGKGLGVDENGNYYASFDFGADGLGNGYTAPANLYDVNNRHQTVYLYANIKLSGTFKNGIDVRTTIRNASTLSDQGKSVTVARIKPNGVYTNAGSKLAGNLNSDGFTPVIIKVDLVSSTGAIKVGSGDWVALNSFESSYAHPTDGTAHILGSLNFIRAAGSTPEGVLMISEAAAYTELNLEDKIAELSDKDKAEFFAGLISANTITSQSANEITADLTLDGGYKDYDLEKLGVEITWESSDTRYVADNGDVTVSQAPTVPVTMTATITAGSEIVTKEIHITLVPKNSSLVSNAVLTQNFDDKAIGDVPAADFAVNNYNNATYKAEYVVDEDTDSTVVHFENQSSGKAVYLTNNKVYSMPYNSRYYISFDYKYERKDKTGEDSGASAFVGTLGLQGNLQTTAQFQFHDRTVAFTSYDTKAGTIITHKYPMPDSIQEGEWFNVTIDYQPVSRSYQVYANGELINDVPAVLAHAEIYKPDQASGYFVHALRGIQLGCSQNGDLYVDNFVTRQATNKDEVYANAAKNVGLMMYAGNYDNVVTGEATLNTAGPAENGIAVDTNNIANLSLTGASAISYNVDGIDATSIAVDEMGKTTITVTGTYNGATETSSATKKASTVAIASVDKADGKPVITLKGDYTGKKVYVAVYEYNTNKLVGIKVVDATATVTADIQVGAENYIRAFILGDNANPVTYSAR